MKTKRLLSIPSKRPNTAVASSSSHVPDSFAEIYKTLPHVENVDPYMLHKKSRDRLRDEDFFDSIMSRCNSYPLHEAFEPVLEKMFNATRAILWEYRSESCDFRSNRLKKEISISNPVFDQIISKKKSTIIYDQITDTQLSQQFVTNSDLPQFFFSITTNNSEIIAIVQLTRSLTSMPCLFDEYDEARSRFISRKFMIYGSSIFSQSRTIKSASTISHYGNLKTTADFITSFIQTDFQCSTVDFWFFYEKMNQVCRYERNSGFVNVYRFATGIVGYVLKNSIEVVNEAKCQNNSNYVPVIDGDGNCPILVASCRFDGRFWAAALRGTRNCYDQTYSGEEAKRLSAFLPFIARSLSFSSNLSKTPATPIDKFEEIVESSLDSAALFASSMDIRRLLKNVESGLKSIVGCQFVRLLIVAKNEKEFVYGDKSFPIFDGISGSTFASQKVSIFENPKAEKKFCAEIDSSDEVDEIQSFLSYPILVSYRVDDKKTLSKSFAQSCIAVVNFLNKDNDEQFNFSDIEKINSVSSFCAHSIQNATSYQSVLSVTNHLRVFMRASKQVLQLSSATNALKEILSAAKEMFSASRVTLFMKNPRGSEKPLYEFLNVEDNQQKSPNYRHRPQNPRNAEEAINRQETVKIHMGPLIICTTPLFDNHMNVLGAMEIGALETKGRVEETTLIESFATIAAISIERLKLEKLAEIGHFHDSFKKLFSEEERESYETPKSLKGSDVFTSDFDVNNEKCDQTEMIKIIFAIFDKFNIKKEFRITNQKLFFFIADISKTYKKSGVHSWKNAVDSLQFVAFSLSLLHLRFEPVEILALFVASLCRNAGHDNYDGMKSVRKRTKVPFEILYRTQCAEEMRNVEFSIRALSKEECNLFSVLDYGHQKKVWKLIIKLILETSHRKHFKVMKSVDEIINEAQFDIGNKKQRLALLILLMKCSTFAFLTRRNFEAAKENAKEVEEEFFALGKVEKCSGLKYSLKDNEKVLNKERSLPGILNSVALASFQSLVSVCSNMSATLEAVKSNIEQLDSIIKEKYKEDEERERKEEEERKRKEDEERRRKEEEERKRKEEEERKRKEEEERKRKEEEERKRKEEEERKRKEEEERIKEEERKKKEEEERKKKEEERIKEEEERKKKEEEEERIKEEERKRKEEEERIKKEIEEKKKMHNEKSKNSKVAAKDDEHFPDDENAKVEEEEEEKSRLSDEERFNVEDEPASDEGDNDDDGE